MSEKRLKVFISLPMRDRTDEEIIEMQELLYSLVSDKYDKLNTFIDEIPDNPNNLLWYLGRSIQLLGEADLAIFASDWAKAPGCIVERLCCHLYKIPSIVASDAVKIRNILNSID